MRSCGLLPAVAMGARAARLASRIDPIARCSGASERRLLIVPANAGASETSDRVLSGNSEHLPLLGQTIVGESLPVAARSGVRDFNGVDHYD